MTVLNSEIIRETAENRRNEIIEWCKTLIRYPSENRHPHGNEGEAQRFIADECRNSGLEVDVFSPDVIPGIKDRPEWLSGRDYSNGRDNVAACWKGTGSGQSLLLSGHVDVAPFEPDDWTICRPYEPLIKDGRLYGRGSADMKCGLTSAFWALRILRDSGFKPSGDVLFESVVDEEFAGGNGTLAARLRGHNADMAVLCEPTRMEVCPASLGAFLGDLTVSGKSGMPYMGSEVPSTIKGAARAVELFSQWQDKWRSENSHPLFSGLGKELNVVLWHIDSTRPGEFTQMSSPISTCIAWIVWCHPGMTEEEFYKRFRMFWREQSDSDPALAPFDLDIQPDFHYVRPGQTEVESPAVQAVVEAFKEYKGSSPAIGGAPFSCDLSIYNAVGNMPTVILGPRGDNLHAPDEWVEIDDIIDMTGILANLILSWCG